MWKKIGIGVAAAIVVTGSLLAAKPAPPHEAAGKAAPAQLVADKSFKPTCKAGAAADSRSDPAWVGASFANDHCQAPTPPKPVNGYSSGRAQIVAGLAVAKKYVDSCDAFQRCVADFVAARQMQAARAQKSLDAAFAVIESHRIAAAQANAKKAAEQAVIAMTAFNEYGCDCPHIQPVSDVIMAQNVQPQVPGAALIAPAASAPAPGAADAPAAGPPVQRGLALFRNPDDLKPALPQKTPLSALHDVTYDLNVGYSDAKIWNSYTGTEDPVHLRSFNGAFTAPTLTVYPSQTVRVRLHNQLPAESVLDCPPPEGRSMVVPACFSITNLHFHGLHISPTGNSDNVFIQVAPGQNFEYEVNIPADHPAGTFFYHPHVHGATAAEVSSGMAGALIVRGTRTLAERSQNGGVADIDTILKTANGSDIKEKVILLQQIAYACFTAPNYQGVVITKQIEGGKSVWICPPGQIGEVKSYLGQLFGPNSWSNSGHFIIINGQLQPQFGEWKPGQGDPIHAGEIQRWRMVHGGMRDPVSMRLIKATDLDAGFATPPSSAAEQSKWVDQHCKTGEVVPQWKFAEDGLTRSSPSLKPLNTLQAGQRADTLVTFPTDGVYCVLDLTSIIAPRPGQKDTRLIGLVKVTGGKPIVGDIGAYITSSLIAANPRMPKDVVQQLRNDDLSAFSPHASLLQEKPVATHNMVMNIDTPVGAPFHFEINQRVYDRDRVDLKPILGTVEDYVLESTNGGHTFHIHINPFQVIDILDPKGNSIWTADGHCTELDLKDKNGNPAPDPDYCDQKNVFRDTINLKVNYHVRVRTRYERYVGEFVIHCHQLDHSDQGMMMNVEVVQSAEARGPRDFDSQ